MYINNKILVGKSEDKELCILPSMSNRHGLITGASGSGKTITLKVLAESFSDAGVPVFLADVKGDLAGTALPGELNEKIQSRVDNLKLEGFTAKQYPVRFWDIYGESGHPVRASISLLGPEILSIMLGLSEAQEGNLAIVFGVAKDENLPLVTLDDLRSALHYVSENRDKYISKYGNITPQSIGVIQRSLLALENQGGKNFFGAPSLDIKDFFANDIDGRGVVNVLHAVELFKNTDLYVPFLLWMLVTLFNESPEVGDLDKPKMVYFFDEAHLLFNNMPSYITKKIIQVVKLIRSRGIGLYFVSQKPTDIPDEVLAQLGNRIQHTLRAYTPAEQKAVKAAADSFRTNPDFDTEKAIMELGTGEALVSFQDEKGTPTVVEKATILPPQSKMGVIESSDRTRIINCSPLLNKYSATVQPVQQFQQTTTQTQKWEPTSAYDNIAKYNREKQEAAKAQETSAVKEATPKETKKTTATKSKNKTAEKAAKEGGKIASRFLGNFFGSAGREIGKSLFKKK